MGISKKKLPIRFDDGLCESDIPESPRTSTIRHSLMPMIPSESIVIWAQHIYMFRCLDSECLLINACNNEDYAKIWTMQASSGHLVFAHAAYNIVSHCTVLVLYTVFCLTCNWVPGMCHEPRWIGYPAPRSPADSFAMAGPIRHCLLRVSPLTSTDWI